VTPARGRGTGGPARHNNSKKKGRRNLQAQYRPRRTGTAAPGRRGGCSWLLMSR